MILQARKPNIPVQKLVGVSNTRPVKFVSGKVPPSDEISLV